MNNDTTQHDTARHTTQHFTDIYSVGHHVWVAGHEYMSNAKELLEAGESYWAGQMLGQAEKAFTLANNLQAGECSIVDGSLCMEVRKMDEWEALGEIVSLREALAGVSLPIVPTDVSRETCSPEPRNVSRETVGMPNTPTPSPMETPPVTYSEGMETYTTHTAPTITDLLAQVVSLIVTQVTEAMESIAESVVEDAIASKDLVDADDLDRALDSHDVTDTVRDIIGDMTFSVTVD